MESSNYNQFIDDIFHLYCRTGISSIENEFIKIAEAYSDDFSKWLRDNRLITGQIEDANVYNALVFLSEIRNNYSPPVTMSDIVKIFMGSKEAKYIPYIIAFNSLFADASVNSILFPFKDIIVACSNLTMKGEIDFASIAKDLSTIKEHYDQYLSGGKKDVEESFVRIKTETIKQKKQRMFAYLFQRFSNEIADAADRSGFSEFADKLRQGALGNPIEVGKFTQMKIEPQDINEAKRMLKYVLPSYDISKSELNYNFIKERSMFFTGKISREQLDALYKKRQGQQDFSKYMDPSMAEYGYHSDENVITDIESISPSDADLLSPNFITLLCVFFVIFHNKVFV